MALLLCLVESKKTKTNTQIDSVLVQQPNQNPWNQLNASMCQWIIALFIFGGTLWLLGNNEKNSCSIWTYHVGKSPWMGIGCLSLKSFECHNLENELIKVELNCGKIGFSFWIFVCVIFIWEKHQFSLSWDYFCGQQSEWLAESFPQFAQKCFPFFVVELLDSNSRWKVTKPDGQKVAKLKGSGNFLVS